MNVASQSVKLRQTALDGGDVVGARQDVDLVPEARDFLRPVPAHSRFGAFAWLAGICGKKNLQLNRPPYLNLYTQ